MAKKKAPATLTGGTGFDYEDHVASCFLLDMLRGTYTFGSTFGRLKRIDWQARDTQRLLDDVVLTLESPTRTHTAEVSIKSNKQITENGFPENFVEAAWEEWLGTESQVFNKETDLLVLVTGDIASGVNTAWQKTLCEAIQTTPERMIARLTPPDDEDSGALSSELQRTLFESLHCPTELKDKGASDELATVELLKHVRVLTFDFEQQPSRDLATALLSCQATLQSGSAQEAETLWKDLLRIAAAKRTTGGSIDHPGLVEELRDRFVLTTYPDYRADLSTIEMVSTDVLSDIRTDIGGAVSLERIELIDRVTKELEEKRLCLIAGESGCGKSAVAKMVGQQRYGRVVAIPSRTISAGQQSEMQQLLRIDHPLIEILRCSGETCLLLFDGLERCSSEGIRLIARISAEILADPRCAHVNVLLVSQFELAERVVSQLLSGGLSSDSLQVQPIDCPEQKDVAFLLTEITSIPYATLHRELRPILRNLKILDWLVRAVGTDSSLSTSNVTGLSSLIEYLWQRWTDAGDLTIARSGLLKRIAEKEADTLTSGVPLSELDHSELTSMGGMQASDLVRVRAERVRFSHDLLGDWARLRVLIEQDPTQNVSRAALPRWHRAVRLYGKWLLDSPNGVQRWGQAIQQCGDASSDSKVVRDLLLEAVILDDEYAATLNDVWSLLIADEGVLLRRLLNRFLFIATIPDPRVQTADLEPEVAAHIAVNYRLPFWPYWKGLLHGLHSHVADVVKLAPLEAAKVARLWLEKTPLEIGEGRAFPWRREAAEIALAVARRTQALNAQGYYFEDDQDRIAYEAALFAATDLPNEVAVFALEMANRRPLPPEITAEIEADKKARRDAASRRKKPAAKQERAMESLLHSSLPRGDKPQPWPDGPAERVSESFRNAVLDGSAWLSLLRSRPSDACEVLLAVCIEEPSERDPYGSSRLIDYYGLDDWHKGYPPLYFRGPFLQFFRQVPELATEFALRLVNFATERWAASQKFQARYDDHDVPEDSELAVSFPLPTGETLWFGNQRVYQWHSEGVCDSRILPCLLMAMEKYLYEQLDAEKEVSKVIDTILDGSTSLAFAGLLIDIGKRNPGLFLKELRPLLGSWVLYFWDRHLVLQRSGFHAGLIGWHGQPAQLQTLAREWHTQEHRKRGLIEIAPFLLTRSADVAAFFRECIARWKASFGDEGEPEFFPTLAAMLDRTNYHDTTTEDGRPAVRYEPPTELAEKNLAGAREAEQDMLALTFPTTCMRMLRGEQTLESTQLDQFWQLIENVAARTSVDDASPSQREDGILGGVAVLFCKHRNYLRNDPDKEAWCMEQVQQVLDRPPPRSPFDSENSGSEWHWDYFLADIGVAMLAEDRTNPLARRLVADSVAAYHRRVTRLTMARANETADFLGEDVRALQNLAIRWAMIARILSRVKQLASVGQVYRGTPIEGLYEEPQIERIQAIAEHWLGASVELSNLFEKGTVDQLSLSDARTQSLAVLDELEDLRPKFFGRQRSQTGLHEARRSKYHREDFGLDVTIVQAAYSWLEASEKTQHNWGKSYFDAVKELLAFTLSTIPTPTDYAQSELDEMPYEFDQWIFSIVSVTIVRADLPEPSSNLWKPFLELGPYAHHFVEMFFWHWFEEGVANSTPEAFMANWIEMIQFAFESDRWKSESPEFYQIDKMVYELLGYHFGDAMANDANFAPLLERHADVFASVAERWFSMPRVLNGFARRVTTPAYARLLCKGIEWIHRSVTALDWHRFRHERDFESNVIHALRDCWDRHRNEIAANSDLRKAFQGLLTELASRGSHAAISLRDSVVESLGSESDITPLN